MNEGDTRYVPLENAFARGTAPPISARESEWDSRVELLEGGDEVRYVAGYGPPSEFDPAEYAHGTPPEPDREVRTTTWDRWKHVRANDVAMRAARERVREELDVDGVGIVTEGTDDPKYRRAIVSVREVVDEDGELVEGERVDPEELAAATPEFVDVTYELDGRTFEARRDVYAEYLKEREE